LTDSIEAAELSKLICNTYRDLNFAFANEISNICEDIDVDSKRLVEQVNYEYPRSNIALPSPGVGGYCLTKDPIIYSNPSIKLSLKPKSGFFSREINEYAEKSPYRSLIKFSRTNKLKLSDLNILVIGIAFKGSPKTDDYRFSTGVNFCNLIQNKVKNLWVKDFQIGSKKIKELGYKNIDSIKKVDAIFILNNHEKNSDIVLLDWLKKRSKKLLYDGWAQRTNLKSYDDKNFFYSTLGKL
jgi:nucleotide sugar dehydrogenase